MHLGDEVRADDFVVRQLHLVRISRMELQARICVCTHDQRVGVNAVLAANHFARVFDGADGIRAGFRPAVRAGQSQDVRVVVTRGRLHLVGDNLLELQLQVPLDSAALTVLQVEKRLQRGVAREVIEFVQLALIQRNSQIVFFAEECDPGIRGHAGAVAVGAAGSQGLINLESVLPENGNLAALRHGLYDGEHFLADQPTRFVSGRQCGQGNADAFGDCVKKSCHFLKSSYVVSVNLWLWLSWWLWLWLS
ncbi:MAG: hypothetical protein ILNGONEN_01142 [Syntrophorhabdaceae bacterium]|nr:hypothetical protein [Syntrophorhabdaceae bacterium]